MIQLDHETDPFHILGALTSKMESVDKFSASNISSMWYVQVCVVDTLARAPAKKHSTIGSEPSFRT